MDSTVLHQGGNGWRSTTRLTNINDYLYERIAQNHIFFRLQGDLFKTLVSTTKHSQFYPFMQPKISDPLLRASLMVLLLPGGLLFLVTDAAAATQLLRGESVVLIQQETVAEEKCGFGQSFRTNNRLY